MRFRFPPERFGGLIPRATAEGKPTDAAQTAHNVMFSGRGIRPLSVAAPFLKLHDGNGLLEGLTDDQIEAITKPVAPTLASKPKICLPLAWITSIKAYGYVAYTDDAGAFHVETKGPQTLTGLSIEYTETGFNIKGTVPSNGYFTPSEASITYYKLIGPIYEFTFASDATAYANGGPETGATYPATPQSGDGPIPSCSIPLYRPFAGDKIQYASLEIVDAIGGPQWSGEVTSTNVDAPRYGLYSGNVSFVMDLHYREHGQRFYYYCCSHLKSDATAEATADMREGPPSEISDLVIVQPGEMVNLTLPSFDPPYDGLRLYRAERGGNFFLADEYRIPDTGGGTRYWEKNGSADYTPWADNELGITGSEPLSLAFGNYIGTSATILKGSLIHPAGFGVYFRTSESSDEDWDGTARYYLHFSEPFKLHVWPWKMVFDEEIMAIALSGSTILVFTQRTVLGVEYGKVYAVSGNNPERMSCDLVSDHTPLLSIDGLCKIGDRIFWPSYDGLIQYSGGGVRNLTADYYERADWATLEPETFEAAVADNSIFLEGDQEGDDTNLRFDLNEEGITALATYSDSFTDPPITGTITWKSGKIRFDQPTYVDYVRIAANNSTVNLTIWADGVASSELAANTATAGQAWQSLAGWSLPVMKTLEYQISSTGTIQAPPEWITRTVIPVKDAVTLTPRNVDVWGDIWLKPETDDRFVAVSLAGQGTGAVRLAFKNRAGTATVKPDGSIEYLTISNGTAVALPRSVINNPLQDLWRLAVTDEDGTELTQPIDELVLYVRRRVEVQQGVRRVNSSPMAPWLVEDYVFAAGPVWIKSVRVNYQTLPDGTTISGKLYLNGALDDDATSITISLSGAEWTPATALRCTSFQIAFVDQDENPADHLVSGWALEARTAEPFGEEGIRIVDPPSTRKLLFSAKDRARLACGSVSASTSTEIALIIKCDDVEKYNESISNGKLITFARNSMTEASLVEIDIDPGIDVATGKGQFYSAIFLPWTRRSVKGIKTLHLTADDAGIPEWSHVEYDFGELVEIVSARVWADSTVTMDIYKDGATASSYNKAATTSTGEFEIGSSLGQVSSVCIGIRADKNYLVNGISLFVRTVQPIGPGGIDMVNPDHQLANYFSAEDRQTMRLAMVDARTYPVALTVSLDGSAQTAESVANAEIKHLPMTWTAASLFKINAPCDALDRVRLIPLRIVEMPGRVFHWTAADPNYPPWLGIQGKLTDTPELVSAIVYASSYTNLQWNLYKDGATSSPTEIAVSSAAEFSLGSLGICQLLEQGFVDSQTGARLDHVVKEIWIFGRETINIPNGGWIESNGQARLNWLRLYLEFKDTGSFAVARADADDDVAVTWAAGGASQTGFTLDDIEPYKLPWALPSAKKWEVSFACASRPRQIHLLGRVVHILKNSHPGAALEITAAGEPWSWLGHEIKADWPVKWNAMYVKAKAYPVTVLLYRDGVLAKTIIFYDGKPRKYNFPPRSARWGLDVLHDENTQVWAVGLATSSERLRA